MLGQKKIRAICDKVLAASPADQTEVVVLGEDSGLTRFANSYIHQNVAESNVELRVRVVLGKHPEARIGVASTNDLSAAAIRRVVETATTIAQHQKENSEFHSLPGPAPIPALSAFVERTAGFTPEGRAKVAGLICQKAVDAGVVASGAFTTGSYEYAVANSLGIFAYFPTTLADINTVIMSDTGSGYADFSSLDVKDIVDRCEAIASEAVGKALRSRSPVALAPGDYEVILEEYAVADILDFLGYLGFSAQAVQEGRSFMGGKFGQKIVGENITIWDDGLSLVNLPMPFDFEGVPKQRVTFFDKGIATAVVYDSYTAGKEGKQSTGHALPAPNTFGPLPLHTAMATGNATKEEMLKGIKKGLWVTRFHYTRVVHPLLTIITGMTRDGTFLIENGEITQPVKNLRFTQSYLEALNNVEAIGQTAKLQRGFLGGNLVPALKIAKFTFSGATEF